jgi:cellobiose PTS system EIIB component
MSTSLLVKRMKQSAEKQGKNYQIWAIPDDIIRDHIGKADVVLVGPHIRYQLENIREMAKNKAIPVAIINTIDYGMFNGEKVLNDAEQLKREFDNTW